MEDLKSASDLGSLGGFEPTTCPQQCLGARAGSRWPDAGWRSGQASSADTMALFITFLTFHSSAFRPRPTPGLPLEELPVGRKCAAETPRAADKE